MEERDVETLPEEKETEVTALMEEREKRSSGLSLVGNAAIWWVIVLFGW